MANNKKIEDIFDEVDQVKDAKKNKPRVPTPRKVAAQPVKPPLSESSPEINSKSKVPFYVMIVFVILILAGIIYLVITGTLIDTVEKSTDTVVNTVTDVVDDVVGTTENSGTNSTIDFDSTELNSGPLDTDGDGLTDEEETQLGTSTTSVDTDGDQLFDREEVKVYNTNPLSNDSDNDGQLDGVEIENGFNPNGPGLLLDLTKEIDNL